MPTTQEKLNDLLDQAVDKSKTYEEKTLISIQAVELDRTLSNRFLSETIENEIVDRFRDNLMDINIIKPLILNNNKFALKILLQLFSEENHEGAYNQSIELFRESTTPSSIKQSIFDVINAGIAKHKENADKENNSAAATTPVKKKVSLSDDVTDNETDSNRSTLPKDGKLVNKAHHKVGCTIMCVTDIVYDNPALNQINKNGLFAFLNINPNFDSYNFDPKAAIRAEHGLNRHLPQVDDASLLNFDSIFPNVASANDDALPDQAYSLLESFGLNPLGDISLVAALVAFQS